MPRAEKKGKWVLLLTGYRVWEDEKVLAIYSSDGSQQYECT